jgi:hypothetical protein
MATAREKWDFLQRNIGDAALLASPVNRVFIKQALVQVDDFMQSLLSELDQAKKGDAHGGR